MKVDVGPHTIQIGGVAWFATFYGATPIYHAWVRPNRSRCGLILGELRDGHYHERMTPLPSRFAIRIGRPCTRCWPELRNQESLFKRTRSPRDESTQEVLDADD